MMKKVSFKRGFSQEKPKSTLERYCEEHEWLRDSHLLRELEGDSVDTDVLDEELSTLQDQRPRTCSGKTLAVLESNPFQILLCVLVLADAAVVVGEILLDLHAIRSQYDESVLMLSQAGRYLKEAYRPVLHGIEHNDMRGLLHRLELHYQSQMTTIQATPEATTMSDTPDYLQVTTNSIAQLQHLLENGEFGAKISVDDFLNKDSISSQEHMHISDRNNATSIYKHDPINDKESETRLFQLEASLDGLPHPLRHKSNAKEQHHIKSSEQFTASHADIHESRQERSIQQIHQTLTPITDDTMDNTTHDTVDMNDTTVQKNLTSFQVWQASPHSDYNHAEKLLKISHMLHYCSIGILGLFVVQFLLRMSLMRLDFFKDKVEMFDAVIITASFCLDLVFLEGSVDGAKGDGTVALLIAFLVWRLLRVVNGLTVTTKKRQEFRVKLQKRARRRAEKRTQDLEEEKQLHLKEIQALRELSAVTGALDMEIISCRPVKPRPVPVQKLNTSVGLSSIAAMSLGFGMSITGTSGQASPASSGGRSRKGSNVFCGVNSINQLQMQHITMAAAPIAKNKLFLRKGGGAKSSTASAVPTKRWSLLSVMRNGFRRYSHEPMEIYKSREARSASSGVLLLSKAPSSDSSFAISVTQCRLPRTEPHNSFDSPQTSMELVSPGSQPSRQQSCESQSLSVGNTGQVIFEVESETSDRDKEASADALNIDNNVDTAELIEIVNDDGRERVKEAQESSVDTAEFQTLEFVSNKSTERSNNEMYAHIGGVHSATVEPICDRNIDATQVAHMGLALGLMELKSHSRSLKGDNHINDSVHFINEHNTSREHNESKQYPQNHSTNALANTLDSKSNESEQCNQTWQTTPHANHNKTCGDVINRRALFANRSFPSIGKIKGRSNYRRRPANQVKQLDSNSANSRHETGQNQHRDIAVSSIPYEPTIVRDRLSSPFENNIINTAEIKRDNNGTVISREQVASCQCPAISTGKHLQTANGIPNHHHMNTSKSATLVSSTETATKSPKVHSDYEIDTLQHATMNSYTTQVNSDGRMLVPGWEYGMSSESSEDEERIGRRRSRGHSCHTIMQTQDVQSDISIV